MPFPQQNAHGSAHGAETCMVVTPKNAVNDGSSNFKDGSRPGGPARNDASSCCPPSAQEHRTACYAPATAAEIRAGEPRITDPAH